MEEHRGRRAGDLTANHDNGTADLDDDHHHTTADQHDHDNPASDDHDGTRAGTHHDRAAA
ncbi:hypothetical protein ABZ639_18775 [Saccharomonospora sp. NPDC006951]